MNIEANDFFLFIEVTQMQHQSALTCTIGLGVVNFSRDVTTYVL